MVVEWRRPLLEPRVRLNLCLITVALGQPNDGTGVAYVLDQLVRSFAETKDVTRQENAHNFLEVSSQLLLERLQSYVLLDLVVPLLVEIGDYVLEAHLLDEIDEFELAYLPIIRDPLVLPAPSTEELVGASQEQDEAQG